MSTLQAYKKTLKKAWGVSPEGIWGHSINFAEHIGKDLVSESGYYIHITEDFQCIAGHIQHPERNVSLPRLTRQTEIIRVKLLGRILKYKSMRYIPKLSKERKLALDKFKELLYHAQLLRWAKPYEAKLLIAWCLLSPFASALKYRPHLWVNGLPNSGKTWTINNVVAPLLNGLSQMTSGLDQPVEGNALPLVIDEFESKIKVRQQTRDQMIEYLRIASTSNQHAPMALVASVIAPRLDEVDQARFINISMKKNTQSKDFHVAKAYFENQDVGDFQSLFLDYIYTHEKNLKRA